MTNIRSLQPIKLTVPPDATVEDRRVYDVINTFPPFSTFSLSNPNSSLTATRGTLGFNLSSVTSVLWMKQVGSSNTGWIPLA